MAMRARELRTAGLAGAQSRRTTIKYHRSLVDAYFVDLMVRHGSGRIGGRQDIEPGTSPAMRQPSQGTNFQLYLLHNFGPPRLEMRPVANRL